LAKATLKLGKNEDDSELRRVVGTLKTELKLMEKALQDAKDLERENNPALAAAEKEAQDRAKRLKEQAERLPDDVRQELIDRMKNVFEKGTDEDVKKVLSD